MGIVRLKIVRASPACRGGTSTLTSAGASADAATSYSIVTSSVFEP